MARKEHEHPARSLDEEIRRAAWDALKIDPNIGVAIVREDGFTEYCNRRIAEFVVGPGSPCDALEGKPWKGLFPEAWIRQRLDLMREMKTSGKPIVLRSIWNGSQYYSLVRTIDVGSDGLTRFLAIMRPVASTTPFLPPDAELEIKQSGMAHLGRLDVLSPRELEVLALVGQGLPSAEIAKILYRSLKTIENHRYAIAKKLKVASSGQLAAMAMQAGLTVADARLKRF